jgi:CRISPR/Cas system CSM-associated protein Csm2 small subunit
MDEQTELSLKLVGDIAGRFLVPPYQRGYRWREEQVRLLITDIWENENKNYCLQPVVVKRLGDDRLELIDGQQRLTTLYLIFLYMKNERLKNFDPCFTIEYKTRPRSGEYLTTLDETKKDDNVDFFHMYRAYSCIKRWFDGQGGRRQYVADKFFGFLFEGVKVIWYEASHEVDSTALFTRLNVGRIPLTNAELVKALLLQQGMPSEQQPGQSSPPDRHRQIEIATQWDQIERDLNDKSFWAFLTNRRAQEYPTRIELIFDMMADTTTAPERFQTFFYFKNEIEAASGKADPRATIWARILKRYYLLKEWYEDRDLYHKVGYLVATGENLAGLVKESEGSTKNAFRARLDAKIQDSLKLSREDVEDLTYHQADKCSRLLLLFNVETVRCLQNSSDRYPFDAHKTEQWTLEHIHAQNADELNKKGQWQEWLNEHRTALAEIRLEDGGQNAPRAALLRRIDDSIDEIKRESFAQLASAIIAFFKTFGSDGSVHAIANLALLSGGANSALNNSVFEVKRRKILELDRAGGYIPICTRRVFLKYYTEAGDQQIHLWSVRDRECYMEAMMSRTGGVLKYLTPTPGAAV